MAAAEKEWLAAVLFIKAAHAREGVRELKLVLGALLPRRQDAPSSHLRGRFPQKEGAAAETVGLGRKEDPLSRPLLIVQRRIGR